MFVTPDGKKIYLSSGVRNGVAEYGLPAGKLETDGKDFADARFLVQDADGNVVLGDISEMISEALVYGAIREFLEECTGSKDDSEMNLLLSSLGEDDLRKMFQTAKLIYMVSKRDGVLNKGKNLKMKNFTTLITCFVIPV